MKKNKKGFTLIELLAVIVVLAVIMVIATGSVVKIIENIRVNAFISSYEMVTRTLKNNVIMANTGLLSIDDITCSSNPSDTNNCYDKYQISNNEYEVKIIGNDSSGYELFFSGKGKFENINVSEAETPKNAIRLNHNSMQGITGEENKPSNINSFLVKIDTNGEINEYDESKGKITTEKKDLFIEYTNELLKLAKLFYDEKINEFNAAIDKFNQPIMESVGHLTNRYCPEGTLISIKRSNNPNFPKYDDDIFDVREEGFNMFRDERVCYLTTGGNNTIMTCLKDDGTLIKPTYTLDDPTDKASCK